MRAERKKEHLENYLRTGHEGNPLFSDIYIEHNALPLLSVDAVDPSTEFLGQKIGYPLMINAMTGGGDFALEINRQLADIASNYRIPMAVGSQIIALELGKESETSFRVVREEMGEGLVLANLNANATPQDALRAIDMVQADALQIHLNVAQELVMKEGDRNFSGVLDRMRKIRDAIPVPIIVKETGTGISGAVAKRLVEEGFQFIDVSGTGGTNFIEIENLRTLERDFSELYGWGIPTAKALINVREQAPDACIIGSGGVRSSMDIVKALIIGADITAASGEILSFLVHGGPDYAKQHLDDQFYKLRALMVMLGAKNIQELKNVPYKVTGRLKGIL
mgnify:CR=1 FL=1